jgi:hypothetical protein
MDACTDVAGTSCCGDCAGRLLELVLHPLRVMDTATRTVHVPENLVQDVEERLTRQEGMRAMRRPGGAVK